MIRIHRHYLYQPLTLIHPLPSTMLRVRVTDDDGAIPPDDIVTIISKCPCLTSLQQ